MYSAVMVAATGLTNQQRRLDTIADNLANVNTAGFKASRLDFKDALYTANSLGLVATPAPLGNTQRGHGVMVSMIGRIFSDGSISQTGIELDFALEGEAFFQLQSSSGETLFTRGGNFYITEDAMGRTFLVDSSGSFIHDAAGQRIEIPQGTMSITCDEAGVLTFTGADGSEVLGQTGLGLFTFVNLKGLESAGNGYYRQGVAAGEKLAAQSFKVRQGALESSNVNLTEEMTRMIRAQRAFSLASRALTTADDMEGIANNLRR